VRGKEFKKIRFQIKLSPNATKKIQERKVKEPFLRASTGRPYRLSRKLRAKETSRRSPSTKKQLPAVRWDAGPREQKTTKGEKGEGDASQRLQISKGRKAREVDLQGRSRMRWDVYEGENS